MAEEELELQFGLYRGQIEDGKPHGNGSVTFNPDDIGGRQTFEGNWNAGRREGEGRMVWTTGEQYEGGWKK